MDNSKRSHIPMQERLDLNQTQGASTHEEVKRMQNVPYASVVESIINTKDMFLVYSGNPEAELRVDCYCDAGFKTDRDDIKSQTRYMLNILLLQKLKWKLFGLGSLFQCLKGAIHYHRRYHYVRECIELGDINLLKVHTDDNLADPFTKALPKRKLTQHARSIGLRLASSFM
ncbi:hypothetical protein Tco_1166097 [Tanacetum coccineum]